MKKLLLKVVCVFALLLPAATYAQAPNYVTIPDLNFRAALKQMYPGCFNASDEMDTNCSAITSATELDVQEKTIISLEGIQYFVSLQTLNCRRNNLVGLPPLPNGLLYLDMSYNVNLATLPTLPSSVESLFLMSCLSLNSIPSLPSGLKNLYIQRTLLTALPALPGGLTLLSCEGNRLQSLPALPQSLITLACVRESSLSGLPALPSSLQVLVCMETQLTELPPLPNGLWNLHCENNQLISLPPLPATLTELYITGNNITVLPAFPASLEYLDISNNPLVNISGLPNSLQVFWCNDLALQTLPQLPVGLKSLYCENNKLAELNLQGTSLITLKCTNNYLDFADIEALSPKPVDFNATLQNFLLLPASQGIDYGTSFSIQANVGGTMNSYQWFKASVAISGATSPTLNISNATTADAGYYHCRVTSSAPGNSGITVYTTPVHIIINQEEQTINFGSEMPTKTYGDEPFTVSVSATSGLTVFLSSSDPSIASISGHEITIHKAGSVTITASQPGNEDFLPAQNVTQTLLINKAEQTIAFDALPVKNFNDGPFQLIATTTSGLAITFSSASATVATISGTTLTVTGTGTSIITATQPGNENYLPAQATQILTVLLPKPTIPSSFIFLVNEFATQVDFLTIPGNGNGRLVVLKKDGPPDFDPVDDTAYTLGQAVGTNNDNMIGLNLSGSTSYGTIRSLQPGGTYYVEVFEYNTSNGKYSYLTNATATGGQVTMPAQTVSVVTPVNNAVNLNAASLSVTSSASPGASSYTIELYTNSFFTGTPIVKTGSTTSQTFTALSYNTQYFTRVKTNLSAEYGPSTTFMTKPAEADAYVTTPANGAIGQQVTLTVTSNTVSGATSYTIELSTSPTFPAGQVTSGTSSTPSVSFADLNFGTLYYTRIKTNLSPVYGETRTFTTGDALSLSYITTPAQAATGIATTVNITANYLAGASTYIIQLSADNTFLTGVIEKNSSSRTIAFDDLYHNTRYYARVSSNLTPGQWGSSVRYFNTRDHVISSPAANATNVNYNITVTAGTIAGASVYTIEVNPSPTFDPATAIVRSGAASQVFTLGYNTLYYVRCTSDRATGWGSTRSFTTGNPVSLARVTAPANGTTANYTNLQVTVQSLLGATSYTVELNTDPAFNPATALTLSNSTNNIIFPSLSSSTVYYTRVKTSLEPNTWGTTVTNFTTVQSGARVNTVATPEDPVYLADFAVEVYGNPFKQRLKLLVTSPEQANAEITLSDLNGRRIHEFSYPSNSFIEIEKEIPNGLYLLFVKVGPHVKAIRVMKMD